LEILKDALIAFIICLIVGACINGFNPPPPDKPNTNTTENNNPPSTSNSVPTAIVPNQSANEVEHLRANELSWVTESNFEDQVLRSATPVLISFTRERSPACLKMMPILQALADEYAGNLKVVQLDMMDNPSVATKYDISAAPAFLVIDKGQAEGPYQGEISKDRLIGILKPHLNLSVRPLAQSSRTES
jgi:thioredoxin 1